MSTVLPFWHVSLPATELGVGWFSLTTAAGSVTDGERERERLPASNPGLDAPVQILPFGSIWIYLPSQTFAIQSLDSRV
jgi:hypothetical protein